MKSFFLLKNHVFHYLVLMIFFYSSSILTVLTIILLLTPFFSVSFLLNLSSLDLYSLYNFTFFTLYPRYSYSFSFPFIHLLQNSLRSLLQSLSTPFRFPIYPYLIFELLQMYLFSNAAVIWPVRYHL